MKRQFFLLCAALLLFSACCTSGDNHLPGAEERGRLAAKMVNLSAAVDAYFMDMTTAPKESDAVVLQQATSHDPRLLAPEFAAYALKVQYQNPYAVVLLCSSDGKVNNWWFKSGSLVVINEVVQLIGRMGLAFFS